MRKCLGLMRVHGLVLRLILLLLCLAALTPQAAATPILAAPAPSRPAVNITLVANPSTVAAGGATVLSGSGFLNSEQIQISFDSVLKGT
ncbi:MAG: hypothetical protein ACRDGS_07160, partial [Chloroflexota bacterium]